MVTTQEELTYERKGDFAQLLGFDYVEIYVGNAKQAAHFFRTAFGFKAIAYAGLETGEMDRVSYVMQQGKIRIILTSPVTAGSSIAKHLLLHGDSVRDVAFAVDDATLAFDLAVAGGALPVLEPTSFEVEEGRLIKSTIGTFGSTVHSFIERDHSRASYPPKFIPVDDWLDTESTGLSEIDHVAISVEAGRLDEWIDFYRTVLGFSLCHEEDIVTSLSAMNSKVLQSGEGAVKLPFMEPAPGLRKSQIAEYLEFNGGAGVQHIAFLSGDIVKSIQALRNNGIEFLPSPDAYYDMLEERVGRITEDIDALRELGILVDRDEWGYLTQIFTRPLQSRPTMFFEVIQRLGARGFGAGNIKALFEAVEREQAMRGTL